MAPSVAGVRTAPQRTSTARNARALSRSAAKAYGGSRRVAERGPSRDGVARHWMGATGPDCGARLAEQGDGYGWRLVAPPIAYGDWTKAAQVAHEVPVLSAGLSDEVAHLTERTGYAGQPGVLLSG